MTKVDHLEKKFGSKLTFQKDNGLDEEMLSCIGAVTILTEGETKLTPDKPVDPVIVEGDGEVIILSTDERSVLALGPKYCTYSRLDEEEFISEVEECVMKTKWDIMGDEDEEKVGGLEDVALEVLLGKEVCEKIDQEKREEDDLIEARRRQPYDREIQFYY